MFNLKKTIPDLCKEFLNEPEVQLVNISTEDGFTIEQQSQVDIPSDSVSATSSTICSIAESCVKMLSKSSYQIVVIEAEKINLLFVSSTHEGKNIIITACFNKSTNLGKARFLLNRFTEDVAANQ